GEGRIAHPRQRRPERAVRVERHLIQPVAAVIDEVVDLMLVDGVVGALVRRQLLGRDGLETALHGRPVFQTTLLGGGADVRQGAGFGRPRRNLFLTPDPLLGGDGLELGVQGRGRGGGGRSRSGPGLLRSGYAPYGQNPDSDRQGPESSERLHRLSPRKTQGRRAASDKARSRPSPGGFTTLD